MKAKSYCSTLLIIIIICFSTASIRGQGDTSTTVFNLDLSDAPSFNPGNDIVYITGSMLGWAEPGTQPASQTMSRVGESMIWTITMQLPAGEIQYKYFLNAGWMNGEWAGDPNRVFNVNENSTINDVWAIYQPIVSNWVTFNVDMSPAFGFDPDNDVVYLTGSMFGWAMPGTQPENQLMVRQGSTMIWSKTVQMPLGSNQYKYFINYGWGRGEWLDLRSRWINVTEDVTLNDYWAGCEPIVLPYIEDFENSIHDQAPDCWFANGGGTGYGIMGDEDYGSASQKSLRIYHNPDSYVLAITPRLDFDLSTLQITFKTVLTYAIQQQADLYLGTMSDPNDPSTFNQLTAFILTRRTHQPWHEFHYYLNEAPNNHSYIAFKLGGLDNPFWTAANMDDIEISYIPACPAPHLLSATNITLNGATLSWQQLGTLSTWDIAIGHPGFDPALEGNLVQGLLLPSYEATGLNHSTYYEFYVRHYCEGSASEWSSAGLFRTACGDMSLSFVSPLENEVFNTNQTSTIPITFDFVGCEEFGIQVNIVNNLLNTVTSGDWFQINATGSYSLTIPIPNAICSGSYAINIGYWDNVSNNWMNHYSAFFDIINDENKLEVSQPWQNQTLLTGRNHGISWNSSTNEPVNIYYSLDNGNHWHLIMQNVGSSCGTNPWGHNHYGWLVPVTIEGTFNESLIKVVQSNNPEISSVSLPFRITSVMPIDITNPQSGEIFLTGEDIELVFNSLEYSWVDIYFVDRFGGSILLESFEATVGVHNRTYSTTNFVEDYGLRFRIQHYITGFDSPFFAILSDVPTCVEPVNVQAGNITPNSADISWIVFLNPSSWNLEWGVNNFDPGTGNLITGIHTNPYILSSLPGGSNIHFYLQSVCDEGVASDWAGPFSFITGCGNIEVPFFENFDAVAPNQALACWTRWGSGNTNVVDFMSYSSPHSVHFQSQPFGLRMLVTPQINANLTDIRVKFKALPEHYLLQNTIEVGTVPEPGQPDLFTLVGQFGISGMPGHPWISVDVPFTDYAGSDKYIAIRFLNTHDQWQGFYLDDFQIEYLPVCSEPHNLLASGITLNSADLSWQQSGVSAQYDLIYGPNGFDPATEGTLIQGLLLPSYQATDLNHSTYYAFYVRRYCEGSASEWSSAGLFRTACSDISLSFVSPLENEIFNTNQTSTIPVEFDFVGCEEFGIQVHLVNTLLNSVTPIDWFQINATGSYSLTIPIPNAICSGSYAIYIGYWDNVSNNWMNHYSAFFDIINDENKLEVRQPWQNQTIPTGRNIDIRWNSSTDEPVNIYYSLNNGANWHFIMQNVTSNCGTVIWGHNWYNWQVPANIHGTHNESRIKISSLENPLVYSISEPFIIKSEHPLTFIQPIEGDIVPLGGDLDLVFSVTEPSGMNIYIINPVVGGQYLGYYDAIAGVNTITYNTSGWTEGLDYYFGIWHHNGQMFLNGPCFAIIEGVPGCLPPGNIQITNQLPTSADISWLNYGGSALWEMEWGNNFFNPGEGTLLSNIGQNHTSLSGLTPGSAYTFYLASICDGGTRSEWVGPFWFFTPSHYVITAFTGENGSVSPLGLVDVLPGEDQSFIIEPNYGYETEDVLIDGISIGAVNAYTFTNVSANYSIEASFSQLTYTITAMAGSGGTITPAGSLVVNHGASQTFTIAANTGYEVTDVLVDGVSVGAISTYTFENVTTNHSISVSFNLLTFSITASAAENGTISPSGNVYVNYGQNQNFTITPNAGFEIADVVVDGLSLGAISTYTFENVTANHSISVSFNILISTITASAGANGSISPSGDVHVFNGQNQTFTITPDTGYEIANVFVDGISVGAVSEYTFENVITNHSISVSFNILTYTITAIAGPNGSISPSGIVNISYGQNQTFDITPDTGYEIADVLVDGLSVGAIGSYTFASVTSNHSILVSFNILTYTITASAGPNGSISPNGDIVLLHGRHQQFVMTPNEGHYLSALLIDGLAVAPALTYTFSNVTSSHSIYAEFAIYMYSLNYAAGANGSLLGDVQQLVQHGSNGSEVLAVPAEGYHFTGWSDGLLDNPRRELNVTSSLMVTANFSINTYMLTATTGLHGSISPHGNIMIEHGQHQQFVMTPNEGYYLSTLLIDGLAVAPALTYTFSNVTSSHSIHSEFAIYVYSLNYAAGANGSLLGDAQQMVQHGSNGSEVLAVPAEGYHFTGWSDGLLDNPRRDLNVTSSLMVTANFAPFYRLSGKMAFFNEVETLIPSNFPNSGFFVQLADEDGLISNARPVIQGHYSFDGLVPGKAYNLRVWEHSVSGLIEDVWTWNNWSSVTSLDALIIGYMVIGNPQVTVFPWILPTPSSEYTPFYAALADINNSGSHTSLDALMLMYRIVGASGSVPFYGGRHNFQLAGSSMVSPSAKRFPVAPDRLFTAFGHYQAQNQANLVYHEITVPPIELGDNFFNIYFAATGDMNASLDPSLQKSIAAMQYDGSIQAKAGDILLYPLSITNDVDLKAFTLFLSYNPQLVEVLSVEGIEIFAIHPKAAKVNIAWFDVNGKSFGKQKPLGWLRVRILQDIELGTRVFEWLAASDLIAVNSNDQEDLLLKGPYIGFDKSEHPAISHQIYPNPFTHETTLRIMLTHKANVRVQIYNQFGQLIKVVDNQSVQAGEHIVRLNQTDFGGSGTYVYKLDVETDFARQSSRGLLILLK